MNTFFKTLESLSRAILSKKSISYTYMIFLVCTSQLSGQIELYEK